MIKVWDLAYVRYRTPDIEKMEQFLVDFGLIPSARTNSTAYFRGTAPDHHFCIVETAPKAGFTGFAFKATSEDDLHRIAKADGASNVEPIDEPGGGKRVRLTDPTGYRIEVVHGIEDLEEIPARAPLTYNMGTDRGRRGPTQRPEIGPAHVRRLGHIVLRVGDYWKCHAFYTSLFGMRVSDQIYDGDRENIVVGFLHCDRGEAYTDHHTIGLAARPGPIAIDHSAYEVVDLDDVVLGGRYLETKDYFRSWGVGRHWMGSQIFDYWRGPHGFKFEHWTDGDVVNSDHVASLEQVTPEGPGALSQWGLMNPDHVKIYPETVSIGVLDSAAADA